MARIIVTPDEREDVVLLDENVYPVHLDNELSSWQVIQRLAWAVHDAETTEQHRTIPQHGAIPQHSTIPPVHT